MITGADVPGIAVGHWANRGLDWVSAMAAQVVEDAIGASVGPG